MRWPRLLLLGLVSVYPLYWTVQFLLFFVPESLVGYWRGEPIQAVNLSYVGAAAVAGQAALPARWEALILALTLSGLIVLLRGDRYLTGALAIVVFGQSALIAFLSPGRSLRTHLLDAFTGSLVALVLIVVGLHRVLLRTGGCDFFERLAFLSLLGVFPQLCLWLAFRMAYPPFDARFLLLLLGPLYVGAIAAALLPAKGAEKMSYGAARGEILAGSAMACLLLAGIGLSSFSAHAQRSSAADSAVATTP